MANLAERIIDKVLSARFWIAIVMTFGGCILAFKGVVSTEFGVLWGIVIRDYFSRGDRDKTP